MYNRYEESAIRGDGTLYSRPSRAQEAQPGRPVLPPPEANDSHSDDHSKKPSFPALSGILNSVRSLIPRKFETDDILLIVLVILILNDDEDNLELLIALGYLLITGFGKER